MQTTSSGVARLASELAAARCHTDSLFDIIRPDSFYERPIPERHRLIFYLGHLEAFDWNLIARRSLGVESFDASFDKLFEFGIDPAPGALPADLPSEWPNVPDIRRYNGSVRRKLDEVIERAPQEALEMAIEHRWMHAETLAYVLHQLSYERKRGVRQSHTTGLPPAGELIEIPTGVASLGQNREEFGWDNEFDAHDVQVPAFRIGRYKVTNAEYLSFVKEGGSPPFFWSSRAGQWFWRGMFREIPLPLNWPVYVTHRQASDFAAWSGRKLPTEEQYHRAAFGDADAASRRHPWGADAPERKHGNFDFARWDPEPVTASPAGDSAFGVAQMAGNGWEWTRTVFGPFPGFRPSPNYPNYSEPFFDSAHYVLKGASPRTAARLIRASFRNWFRPEYPYPYAAFRCVEE